MPDRMPEIQYLSEILLLLILFYHMLLHNQRAGDDLFKSLIDLFLLKQSENFRICNHSCLDRLHKSIVIMTFRQCPKCIQVNQHYLRMIKGPDHIFHFPEIDCNLPSDTGINLRQSRCRNGCKLHPTLKGRYHKSTEISNHSASQRKDPILSGKIQLQQFFADLLIDRKAFCPLTVSAYM